MEMVAVFPDPPPPEVARTLDLAGYRVGSMDEVLSPHERQIPENSKRAG